MLELFLCSLLTLLPDYLYRRYVQGRRIGKEITLYTVWFELRWGIIGCLLLTVALITTIFYFHPSTKSVIASFRAVPIVSETNGRVAEVFIGGLSDSVKQGDPIFRLDNSKQAAELETARRRVIEIEAQIIQGGAEIAAARGQVDQAQGALQQAIDELGTKEELNRRNSDIVARREIERLQNLVKTRQGGVDAAEAQMKAVASKVEAVLPAQKASAEATLAEAQVTLDKTTIRAGVTGRVEQFALRVGDVVNPFARPAGVLIPTDRRNALAAGFSQIEAQIMKVGMVAEATCISKPWVVIPMVVTGVQDAIAAGQFRGGEQLIEIRQNVQPGTIFVILEPLFPGGLEGVTPGSNCIANAYTSNHELLASKDIGSFKRFGLHAIDAVGLVHAMLLRIQALLLPIRELVFSGH